VKARLSRERFDRLRKTDALTCGVSIHEPENRLSALLAEVAQGVEVTTPKRGVATAGLVPATPSFNREKARRAAAGLPEASRGVTLGGIKIKDLVDEGRRWRTLARCPSAESQGDWLRAPAPVIAGRGALLTTT